MTRILWMGDAAHTGFGRVTESIGVRLLAMGHDVRFLLQNQTWWDHGPKEFYGRWGNSLLVPPHDLLNVLTRGFPEDGWTPEAIVMVADYGQAVRQVAGMGDDLLAAFKGHRVLHYCPVEGPDLSPGWNEFWKIVQPVAMTQFGADEIAKVTGRRPPVIYHGVDTDTFHPLPLTLPEVRHVSGGLIQAEATITTKREAKLDFGLDPDHVILLRADRYMPRKQYSAMLRSLGPLLHERDDVDLLIHCQTSDQGGSMEDEIRKWERQYPRAIAHTMLTRKHNTWRGLHPTKLAELYNAADIYVSSGPEGFGLTIAESLACGVPAVGIDDSAVREVLGPGGILYPVDHYEDNIYNHRWAAPSESGLRDAVLRLVLDPALRIELGALGAEHIKRFNWDVAARQFADLCSAGVVGIAA